MTTTIVGCGKNEKKENDSASKNRETAVDKTLAKRLDSCINKIRPIEKTGIYVYDLTANQPIFAYHEKEKAHTASCMKLLSGIAGLKLLGTDYKYATRLCINGTIQRGTLNGDVVLQTGLDPQFVADNLNFFAAELKHRGVNTVAGNILIEPVLSDPVRSEEHWYPWDLTFSKYGLFYKGSDKTMREWSNCLRRHGITFDKNKVALGRVARGSKVIAQYRNPISLVVGRMWKNSSNVQSTGLLYTIGHKVSPLASPDGAGEKYAKAGVKYLNDFVVKEIGCKDSSAYVIHDGCGLCTHNMLTPQLLVDILKYGYRDKQIYHYLMKLLPISGMRGTLRREIYDAPLRGKIVAKTGTLSHPYGISSLAGYCKGSNGHLLCFAIMNTEMSVLDAHVLQRKLCMELTK